MELPHIGEHCKLETCNRLDFLPMKCEKCKEVFCSEHFRFSAHGCPQALEGDVQVPSCPLCNKPVPFQKGQLPDVMMERHISSDCKINRVSSTKVFTSRCSVKGCRAKEMLPIQCGECRLNFCLSHRNPLDHHCSPPAKSSKKKERSEASRMAGRSFLERFAPERTRQVQHKSSVQTQIEEDEALARALQASLQEPSLSSAPRSRPSQPSPPERPGCRLS